MRIENNPLGPRFYIGPFRIHHGLTGSVIAALGIISKRMIMIELASLLIADDLHDFPWKVK